MEMALRDLTMEQGVLVMVAGLLVWVTGGRMVMGLLALTQEGDRQKSVTALFSQAATAMARQRPEQEAQELIFLLDNLQQRCDRQRYEALLLMLQAQIAERLAADRR